MASTATSEEKIKQILFSEVSLQELKPFFPNREAILACHAKSMAEFFTADRRLAECECCNRRSAEFRVVFHWRGIYHTAKTVIGTIIGIIAIMIGHGILPYRQINFSTTHGFCNDCFKQIRRQQMLGELTEKLCFILIILSAIVLVPVLVITPVLLFSRPTSSDIRMIVVGLGVGLICLAGGLLVADKAVRWCIPKSLKFISKRPIQLIALKKC